MKALVKKHNNFDITGDVKAAEKAPRSNTSKAIEAAKALSHLYVLGTIQDILNGSAGNELNCQSKILKICSDESIKLLKEYDKNILAIKEKP